MRAKQTARLEKETLGFLINNPLPETEPTFSKTDDIYKQNAKKRAIKAIAQARQSRKRKADKKLAYLEQRAIKFLRETPDTGVSEIPYKTRLNKKERNVKEKSQKEGCEILDETTKT